MVANPDQNGIVTQYDTYIYIYTDVCIYIYIACIYIYTHTYTCATIGKPPQPAKEPVAITNSKP